MKKLISYIILLAFLSINNLSFVLAQEEINPLQKESLNIIDKFETITQDNIEKIDNKLKNEDLKEKLETKHEEIKTLLEETKEEIKDTNNKEELKSILEETAKTITLKTTA
jgi:gas vesicle protein